MSRLLILLIAMAIYLGYNNLLSAQENPEKIIEFCYDASGNRITRQVVELKIRSVGTADSAKITNPEQGKNYTEFIDNHKVTVYPNPNKGKFKVVIASYQTYDDASIFLHSVGGVLVFSDEKAKPETQVDIDKFENGAYILTVIISGKSRTWKIIKN